MELEPPTILSDTASTSEYLDAECGSENNDYFQDGIGIDEQEQEDNKHSIIHELREELGGGTGGITADTVPPTQGLNAPNGAMHKSESFSSEKSKELADSQESLIPTAVERSATHTVETVDYLQDNDWKQHKKHIFILSEAGKPIYSLHGNEDNLATLFGIIQALVSFVQHGQDAITSIHARGIKFVFFVRNSLILVAASRSNMSVQQVQLQLR